MALEPVAEPGLPSVAQRFPAAPQRPVLAQQAQLSPPETLRTFRKSGWRRRSRCRIVRSAHTLLNYSVI